MKILYSFLLFLLPVMSSYGQQMGLYSHYLENMFIYNPAVAGAYESVEVLGLVRRQWTNIENAPNAQSVYAHGYTGSYFGFGIGMTNDAAGPTRFTGFHASGARHFDLQMNNNDYLSFGMTLSLFNLVIDESEIEFIDPNDPTLGDGNMSKLSPDVSAGFFYHNDYVFAGLSVQNMIQSRLDLFDHKNKVEDQVFRTYYAIGGADFELNDFFGLKPSALVRYIQGAPLQGEINIRGVFNKMAWLGVGYRTSDAITILGGVQVANIRVGYAYDITLNDLNAYTNGTHEVFMGISLDNIVNLKEEQGGSGRRNFGPGMPGRNRGRGY